MRIGFIGVGVQGGPMAEMIQKAGHELHVWARRPEAIAPYLARGARAAADPRALGAAVELAGLCVVSDADVMQIAVEQGLLEALAPGSVLAIHATVRPATCRDLAARGARHGVHVIDAPVSGSGEAALARRLLVFAGGAPEAIERARPMLECYGNPICVTGASGSGQLAKLINNFLCISNMKLAHDALNLGARFGLDRARLKEAIQAGSGASFSMNSLDRLVNAATAKHVHMLFAKDVGLGREEAAAIGADAGYLAELGDAFLNDLIDMAKG
ncbi:MAG: NAD(P)-dependent oxidoreductase [Gammaproteobacteria bacterium]